MPPSNAKVKGPSEAEIQERLDDYKVLDMAGAEAEAAALPGASLAAFAPVQDVVVGPYRIRPVYDVDFEFLTHLGHLFANFAQGNTEGFKGFVPRGQEAWTLFWLFTNPPEEVEKALADPERGVEWVRAQAKAQFDRNNLAKNLVLYRGIVQQMMVYAGVAIRYEPVGSATEEGAAAPNPTASQQPPTG